MKPRLLIICGPTATGKTGHALKFAKQLNGELVSADARQVYKNFDIGTGKEVELLRAGHASKHDGYWLINGIPIYLYDLIDGKQQFSAYDYALAAQARIQAIWSTNKLPILVGGTGLYIAMTIAGAETGGIAQNDALREVLAGLSTQQLQDVLLLLDQVKLDGLNQSDYQNPRRLQRQIEIAYRVAKNDVWQTLLNKYPLFAQVPFEGGGKVFNGLKVLKADMLSIGLLMPTDALEAAIAKRVASMFDLRLADEVAMLLGLGYTFSDPAMRAIGYQEFASKEPIEKIQSGIVLHTRQYAKRQFTWFKAQPNVRWINVSTARGFAEAENMVKMWYHKRV